MAKIQPNDPDHTVEETITPAADPQDTIINESLINEQVKQFEASLADNCPICKIGQVHPQKTETGKSYYACRQPNCRFISWGKPYHFECPTCRNPYLIRVDKPNTGAGLKCPRATCLYRQAGLSSPSKAPKIEWENRTTGSNPIPTKKRKKMVPKRLVRRNR
ncbi:MAG: hypothetical protein QNI95_18150 [Desulfobacterales bacterium]|nr:hypothetical protein [Desulfobacterales bacterium]